MCGVCSMKKKIKKLKIRVPHPTHFSPLLSTHTSHTKREPKGKQELTNVRTHELTNSQREANHPSEWHNAGLKSNERTQMSHALTPPLMNFQRKGSQL
jgi:hypothetical protein